MSDTETLTQLTAEITANFVANNAVAVGDVGDMIRAIYDALAGLEKPVVEEQPEEIVPAVSARKSLADPTKIISMIDGKPYSMLKRHLAQHGLTPDEYRSRYNLPASYPMTAPAYSEQRKALAMKIGLGRKPAEPEAPVEPVVVAPEPVVEAAPKKTRRKLGIKVDETSAPARPVAAAAPKARRAKPKAAPKAPADSK